MSRIRDRALELLEDLILGGANFVPKLTLSKTLDGATA